MNPLNISLSSTEVKKVRKTRSDKGKPRPILKESIQPSGEIDHFTKTPEAKALFNTHKRQNNNLFGINQYAVTNSLVPYPLRYAIADALLKDGKPINYVIKYTALSRETVCKLKNGEIKLIRSVADKVLEHETDNLVILGNTLLDRISEKDVENASLLQKTTAYCQLFDKRRLLNNQSTGNVSIVQQLAEISKETSKAEIMLSKLKSIGDK